MKSVLTMTKLLANTSTVNIQLTRFLNNLLVFFGSREDFIKGKKVVTSYNETIEI
jgi:hypothetical protein